MVKVIKKQIFKNQIKIKIFKKRKKKEEEELEWIEPRIIKSQSFTKQQSNICTTLLFK
jgi:hypothetical protein